MYSNSKLSPRLSSEEGGYYLTINFAINRKYKLFGSRSVSFLPSRIVYL